MTASTLIFWPVLFVMELTQNCGPKRACPFFATYQIFHTLDIIKNQRGPITFWRLQLNMTVLTLVNSNPSIRHPDNGTTLQRPKRAHPPSWHGWPHIVSSTLEPSLNPTIFVEWRKITKFQTITHNGFALFITSTPP